MIFIFVMLMGEFATAVVVRGENQYRWNRNF
ncbi:MAG: hypothetical protein CM1200mP41_22630 [Gammaproteobacteria bacterium]|nr:MAG: hypothetical protein CM1200mP41_22630 [Gammaproteobacteria bacterium]